MELGLWDLGHLYKTNQLFESDLKIAKNKLKILEKYRNNLNKKETILDYLKNETELSIILEKLAVYSYCKKDDNGKIEQNIKNYGVVNDFFAEVNEKLAFSKTELSKLDEDFLQELKQDSDFVDYDRTIEDIIRFKKHTLSEKEEQVMAQVSGFTNPDDIFSVLSNLEMNHGSFIDENGKEIRLSPQNYNLCMNLPNAETRKRVMEAYYAEYAKLSQTYAGLLSSHIKYENFVARSHNFESVLDMKCYGEEVDKNVMLNNIKNVSAHKDLLHKYFELKRKILGLKEFSTSDISVQLFAESSKKEEYEQVVKDIAEAVKVLGEDYSQKFIEAVKNGWIDAFTRENKTSGGYTTGTYQEHPFILLNFDGTREWASALAHEFGHAMHSYYSAQYQPYPKYEYTLFVAEIVSLTNEILYNKYLIKNTTDKQEKMKLYAEFLQLFELNVFDSTMLAEFELYIHDKSWNGETLTAEDYVAKFKEIAQDYLGKNVKMCKYYEYSWSRKSHIYRDYYLYKYSMGFCSACYLASKILADKTGKTVENYRKFLTLGGSKSPLESLKVAGIDVESNLIYDEAFDMFEEYVDNLGMLFKD